MDNIQIEKILKSNSRTKNCFIGCFASDKIPSTARTVCPYCMVINTDPSSLAGSHWTAIYVKSKKEVEYYDSLGIWPPLSADIENFLNQFKLIHYNNEPLQSANASTCGKHVIYFVYRKCQNIPFVNIIDQIKRSKSGADRLVSSFVSYLQNV